MRDILWFCLRIGNPDIIAGDLDLTKKAELESLKKDIAEIKIMQKH